MTDNNLSEGAAPTKAAAKASHWWTLLRLAVGIGLLVYLAKSHIIDFRSLTRVVTSWPITLAALVLIFLDIAFMALRLCWLFRPHNLRMPFKNSLELTLVSSFFATFLPGAAGGDLPKLYYAVRENKGRRAEIFTVIAFDRVVGLFSLLLQPLLFAPFFLGLIRTAPVLRFLLAASAVLAAAMLIVYLLCIFQRPPMESTARWASRFLPGKKIPERVIATLGAYRSSPGVLLAAMAASIASNFTLIASTALAIYLLNPASLSWRVCLVIPMGDVANSLPLTPGGLGVGESAFGALFKIAGLSGGAEALLCWRIWRAIVGLAGLVIYLRGMRRTVFDPAEEST